MVREREQGRNRHGGEEGAGVVRGSRCEEGAGVVRREQV